MKQNVLVVVFVATACGLTLWYKTFHRNSDEPVSSQVAKLAQGNAKSSSKEQDLKPILVSAASPDEGMKAALHKRLQEIRAILTTAKGDTWPYFEELIDLYQLGNAKEDVLQLVLDMMALHPDWMTPLEACAQIYMSESEWSLAIPYLEQVVDNTARSARYKLDLMIANYELGDSEEVVKLAKYALRFEKDMMQSHPTDYVFRYCLIEGLARIKRGDDHRGKQTIIHCGDDFIKDERTRINYQRKMTKIANESDLLATMSWRDVMAALSIKT